MQAPYVRRLTVESLGGVCSLATKFTRVVARWLLVDCTGSRYCPFLVGCLAARWLVLLIFTFIVRSRCGNWGVHLYVCALDWLDGIPMAMAMKLLCILRSGGLGWLQTCFASTGWLGAHRLVTRLRVAMTEMSVFVRVQCCVGWCGHQCWSSDTVIVWGVWCTINVVGTGAVGFFVQRWVAWLQIKFHRNCGVY